MGFQFNNIAIIGVGLMGGSLGLALKEQGLVKKVIGLGRNPDKLNLAKKRGAIDLGTTDWKSGIAHAEIVIICTPVGLILPIIRQLFNDFPEGCIVTDVGSTKKTIVYGAEKILKKRKGEVYFVGSHPMAGSEQFGIESAQKDLYKKSICLVTPIKTSNSKAVNNIKKLWESVGCHVLEISPEKHDQAVAVVSHLPHILATTLVNTIARLNSKNSKLSKIASSGFRDTTRIASSHPQLWTDICLDNQESVLKSIELFEKEIKNFKKSISGNKSKELFKKFNSAKKFRDTMYHI